MQNLQGNTNDTYLGQLQATCDSLGSLQQVARVNVFNFCGTFRLILPPYDSL